MANLLNPTHPFQQLNLWTARFTNNDYTQIDTNDWRPTTYKPDFASITVHDVVQIKPKTYKTKFTLQCAMIDTNRHIRIQAESKYNDPAFYQSFKADSHQDAIETSLNIAHAYVRRLNINMVEIRDIITNENKLDKIETELETQGWAKLTDDAGITHETKNNVDYITVRVLMSDDMTVKTTYKAKDAALIDVVCSIIRSTDELSLKILDFIAEMDECPEYIMDTHPEIFGNACCWYNTAIDLADKYHNELATEEQDYINLLESCLQ